MKKNILLVLIATVFIICSSFYAGVRYEKNVKIPFESRLTAGLSNIRNQSVSAPRALGNRFQRDAEGGNISGKVVSNENNTVTVQLQNGGTKLVIVPLSAVVTKSNVVKISDITNDQYVMVSGKINTDGSITAQSIQIRAENTLIKNNKTGN